MDVEGQQVVLHEAPIFRLVLSDDTEVRFLSAVRPGESVYRAACIAEHFLR